jgi:tight adherence protein C
MPTELLYGLLFVVTVLASYAFLMTWWPQRSNRRLRDLRHSPASDPSGPGPSQADLPVRWIRWRNRLTQALLQLSPWLVPKARKPASEQTLGASPQSQALRRQLLNAGIASPQAVVVFQVLQALLTGLLPVCTLLLWWWHPPSLQRASMLIVLLLAGMVGFYLPLAVLHRLIRQRQAVLFKGFPDALDLMRMCIQAGLGLDATLERVGREIRLSCPALSQELAMTGYELRAGASRAQALRHLAERVALSDVEAWVSTLIQSDRFGTSISESLQVYSHALRNKRKLAAQEAAAKLPIKLLIPLVFCLFPGLLTVLLGPAVINIMTHLMPVLSGAH